jgi:tetratricopeptide (TPR) repeat protein
MDQFSATLDRGWDLAQRGDAQGALACARSALEMDPNSPEVHNLLGYSAAMAGDSDEAVEFYRQAIALDETYFEAMLNCAEVLMHPLSDWDAAIEMCNEALDFAETKEETADCVLLKIDALLGKGEREAARRAVAQLPEGPFENPSYEFLIGRALYEVGELDAARPHIETAAKDPDYADAHYYMGLLRDEAGDIGGAIECFLRVRMLDQQHPPPPWSPSPEAFGDIVRKVISTLDAILARYVREAEVYVVDQPGAELVVDGVDPRALIMLDTPPADGHRGGAKGTVYARLFIYQRNLERAAGTLENVEPELRRAVEREITHVFIDHAPPSQDQSQLN